MGERCRVGRSSDRGGIADGGRVSYLGRCSVRNFSGSWHFDRMSLITYNGVEPVLLISGVLHNAVHTVRLHQRVGSVHGISGASLLLLFDVSAVTIVDRILEVVVGWCFDFSVGNFPNRYNW